MLLSPAPLMPPGATLLHVHNEAYISLNHARPSQNAVGLLTGGQLLAFFVLCHVCASLMCLFLCVCVCVCVRVCVSMCVHYVYLHYVSQLSHGCG